MIPKLTLKKATHLRMLSDEGWVNAGLLQVISHQFV